MSARALWRRHANALARRRWRGCLSRLHGRGPTQDAAHHAFKGLSLWAMDGTTLRTPDSPANREHFGAQGYASGKVASYPQVRAVTLTAIPTHLVADINFGRYDTNEMVYAKSLLPQIPEDSLTVFDKGFLAAEILCGLTMNARNRHFLIPAKANTCWEVISGTADDATVRMRVSQQARKKCPALPESWNARAIRAIDARGRERVLLTSLRDRRRFKPADIVACYERRWQIETSYGELKQSMLGSELTLRSRTVEGVYQEIWGALIAYNLIRREIASAAWEAKLAPTDISFVRALHTIQHEMMWAALTPAYAKLPACLQRLRERLKSLPNEKRPGRACDRVVKSRPKRYTVRYLKKDIEGSPTPSRTQGPRRTERATFAALRSRTVLSVVLTPVPPQCASPSQALILLIRLIAEARSAEPSCNGHSQAAR